MPDPYYYNPANKRDISVGAYCNTPLLRRQEPFPDAYTCRKGFLSAHIEYASQAGRFGLDIK